MNAKNSNLLLMSIILLTALLIVAHSYFPKRTYIALPRPAAIYSIDGSELEKGRSAANWLDSASRSYRCVYPEDFKTDDYYCGFSLNLTPSGTRGVNLSGYDRIKLDIGYTGLAKRIRLYTRNFDPAYSVDDDSNSLKFNAAFFDTDQIDSTVVIDKKEFTVADWWLTLYNIPRPLSHPDLRNTIVVGIDFAENRLPTGVHDFEIRQIKFEGEWISKERWYLLILCTWLLGVFIYVSVKSLSLRRQTRQGAEKISELHEKNDLLRNESDRFRKLSTVDSLTNTYNRFGLDQIVNTLLLVNSDARKNGNAPSYALILIDIDHFKRVNDRRGQDVGDRILQKVAAIIKKCSRPQDFVGRWGGEEFLVILPATNKAAALAVAEKIRLAVSKTEFEPEVPLVVTVSAGVCERLRDEEFASSFQRVDNALFKAKEQGRNCCCLASEQLENDFSVGLPKKY